MNLYNFILLVTFLSGAVNMVESRRAKPRDAKKRGNSEKAEMDSMICPDCDRLFCTVRKASKLKCKGGKTTDICGCCPVCAMQMGESCGGEWNYLGKCDVGLYCKADVSNVLTPPFYQQIKTEVPMGGMPEGTCVKNQGGMMEAPNDDGGTQTGRNIKIKDGSPTCEPKCTPGYCLTNPRSVCSAVDVVDMKRDCQGPCQHTSCQACSWVDPDPDCVACALNDYGCIKRFAKCIKRSYCTRSKFPCKAIAEKDHVGKFQCMVPKCLDKS